MRPYAPADTDAVLADLLAEPSHRPRRRPPRRPPGPRRDVRRLPGLAGSADRRRPGGPRHRTAVHPPGRGPRRGPRRRGHRHRDADGVGQDACATRCPILQAIVDDPASRALMLFPTKALGQDQVTEFGELAAAAGLPISTSTYDGDTPAPIRSAIRGGRPGRGHQPGHAPLGDPPPPHQVVPAVRAAPRHRDRRAAYLSRHLRRPRRQRPASAAPASAPTTGASR